jgi:hypothetical protein
VQNLTLHWTLAAALLGTSAVACLPTTQLVRKTEQQLLEIRTDPPGATVWLRDEHGSQLLGRSPVRLTRPVTFQQIKTDQGACAANGAGEGLMAGLDLANGSESAAVLGLVGLLAGAASGAAACADGGGEVTLESEPFSVVATLDGYLPEIRQVRIPRHTNVIRLELIPAPANATGRPGMPRTANAIRVEPIVLTQGEPEEGALDWLNAELLNRLVRWRLPLAAEDQEEVGLRLQTHLNWVDGRCYLSATLIEQETDQPLRVASEDAECTRAALAQAFERMAAQFSRDPGDALVRTRSPAVPISP